MRIITKNTNNIKAFTIIEIMVVVIIIGILAVLVVPNFIGRVDDAKIAKAKTDIASIKTQLSLYRIDNGVYPAQGQGLDALVKKPSSSPAVNNWKGPYIENMPKDPWGNDYKYQNPGTRGVVDIYSFGPNGETATPEEYIGSWNLN